MLLIKDFDKVFQMAIEVNAIINKMNLEAKKQNNLADKIDEIIGKNNDLWDLILAYKESFVEYENAINSIHDLGITVDQAFKLNDLLKILQENRKLSGVKLLRSSLLKKKVLL